MPEEKEFTIIGEEDPIEREPEARIEESEQEASRYAQLWQRIRQLGIAEPVLRVGTTIVTLAVVVVVVIALSNLIENKPSTGPEDDAAASREGDTSGSQSIAPGAVVQKDLLEAYSQPDTIFFGSISRQAEPQTVIPSRPRVAVTAYTVEAGDSVFSIAEQFGLEPETVLWGNYETLKDNPRFLEIGQELNILPTNGVYYKYNVGESLTAIAKQLGVTVEDIVEYPGNNLDPYETDPENPAIEDGTWLIIPGGERELADWGPPAITRTNAASAAYYGAGHCGDVYSGPIGDGIFMWPTPATYLSGYEYNPGIHDGIDIGGAEGNAVWATDSGVVVYAGWSEYGYGNLVVIDHGNGWQSAYAHLQYYNVGCGQAVYRGNTIGSLGNTGNSSGAHLHFELRSSVYGKVNPFNYISDAP